MSWSGTVTCSHCYQKGHNKRKCPELTRDILDYYQRYSRAAKRNEEEGLTTAAEHYGRSAEAYRAKYIKRTKIDPATGEKVTNKAAKAERMKNVTCGYCCQSGHTRRTCEAVKLDKMVFVEMSRRDRAAALEGAREVGIGVGSLVPMRVYGYHGPKDDQQYGYYLSLRYVKSIDWKAVDSSTPVLYAHHIEASKLGSSRPARHTGRDQIRKMATAYEEAVAHNQSQPEALEVDQGGHREALHAGRHHGDADEEREHRQHARRQHHLRLHVQETEQNSAPCYASSQRLPLSLLQSLPAGYLVE